MRFWELFKGENMLYLLSWVIYGLVVGVLAKIVASFFFPVSNEVVGFAPTVLTGVVGSFVGGFLNFLLGHSHYVWAPSGIVMGVIGASVALFALHYYQTNKVS